MRQTYGVALFYSTHEAMKAEKEAKEAQLQVRIIPTPEKIYASCGFSLKYPLADEQQLIEVLKKVDIHAEGFYHAAQDGLKTAYQRRKGH